jgi:NADH/NAD ratio-sensing transcriptional regulator Rex
MVTKIKLSEIESMTSKELANYIEQITQTEICKDLNYCNQLIKIFLKK